MVWCGFQRNPQTIQWHQIAFASLDTLPMQFYPPTVTGREVASEQCEEAGDRNADAGGYFLNGRSALRTPDADKMTGTCPIFDLSPQPLHTHR
jgi:hypothetical protein